MLHLIKGLRRAVRLIFLVRSIEHGIPSKADKGRFHTDGQPTTYLASSATTAVLEVLGRFQSFRRNAYRMLTVDVVIESMVDLTDPVTRKTYGVTKRTLMARDHRPCQQLASRLRAEGVEAIWTFSRADRQGRQLVVFLDLLSPKSRIHVRGAHRIRVSVRALGSSDRTRQRKR
jgi:hypothetical protein